MRFLRPSLALCATLLLGAQDASPLKLPAVTAEGGTLGAALRSRATVRAFSGPGLTLAEAGQLLWAAQGENRPGKRTVPSAHAKYPLELYLLTAGGTGLGAGMYHYVPGSHTLARVSDGGPEALLGRVKGMQPWIAAAPAVFVMAGDPTRIEASGKGPALSMTYYEAGSAAQGLLLQAAALGLGAGTAAGVDMEAVAAGLKLPKGIQALMLLPAGHPKR
jgi:SagB-type dehydrogenase family enzyme